MSATRGPAPANPEPLRHLTRVEIEVKLARYFPTWSKSRGNYGGMHVYTLLLGSAIRLVISIIPWEGWRWELRTFATGDIIASSPSSTYNDGPISLLASDVWVRLDRRITELRRQARGLLDQVDTLEAGLPPVAKERGLEAPDGR